MTTMSAAKRAKTRRGLPAAIGLGLAGGMRTMVPPATLALRDGRPRSGPLRLAIVLAAAGELAADKHPGTPSRTDPVGLGGRFTASGAAGWACGGPLGGLLAATTALGSAFAMHRLRGGLGERTGLPDPVLGALEDSLAMAIARAVTLKPLNPAPPSPPPLAANSPPTKPPTTRSSTRTPAPAPHPPASPPPASPKAANRLAPSGSGRGRGSRPRPRRWRPGRRSPR
jgi:hypothetical protein